MNEVATESKKVHRPLGGKPVARRRNTSQLKSVPQQRSMREKVRAEAVSLAATLDRSRPLSSDRLEQEARGLLDTMGLDASYLGFAMVMISNEFWRDQLTGVDFSRRLLLLPHCLKHAEGCPADYDEFGLDCRKCGACTIADFKVTAEDLGYKVLVAEGSPIVLKIIVSGYVDAIVGVACLNVLEKALDKVLQVGIPSIAIPLLSSDCKNTSVDDDWVGEVIDLHREPPKIQTRSYVPLLRSAGELFQEEQLDHLAGRPRRQNWMADSSKRAGANGDEVRKEDPAVKISGQKPRGGLLADPIASTEAIGFDWLARGGKRFRPFITLASYDALQGAQATLPEGAGGKIEFSDSVRRVAMAIETFHKASLIHDDIEDDDSHRYGIPSLHRRHGVPIALNVGDYLIGLGYRLVSRETKDLGPACVSEILDRLADAHIKLSEGQGAELTWRTSENKALTPLDALKIYALKTSPAFEVALYAGLRLAGPVDSYEKMITSFSRNLGVGFQILNDLKDWRGDEENQRRSGQDVLAARPTLLLALAIDGTETQQRESLTQMMSQSERSSEDLFRIREIFDAVGVIEKAETLVEKYRYRASDIADSVENADLKQVLQFLVNTVLDEPELAETEKESSLLPVIEVA